MTSEQFIESTFFHIVTLCVYRVCFTSSCRPQLCLTSIYDFELYFKRQMLILQRSSIQFHCLKEAVMIFWWSAWGDPLRLTGRQISRINKLIARCYAQSEHYCQIERDQLNLFLVSEAQNAKLTHRCSFLRTLSGCVCACACVCMCVCACVCVRARALELYLKHWALSFLIPQWSKVSSRSALGCRRAQVAVKSKKHLPEIKSSSISSATPIPLYEVWVEQ